ncbi:uncharacterized protein E0L32_004282 [Thyridium curvatum]|uniref:DNA polymerase V n=1 Tax=Thyridium curvatum TaxID=1093900 RepID=A0A507BAF8_9PEZI|nr:uncharacterized protein E0L32_004282 [Thyridium curvatum]TPX15584.1 hypothetical protein E0L32_004282 [Thyridium curvatum]
MGSKRKRAVRDTLTGSLPIPKKSKVENTKNEHAVSKAEKQKLFNDTTPFPENLSREDHDRERLLYKLLGSEDVEDRIGAAAAIIGGLLGGEGVPEAVLRRHLERRLFRGLASGNDAARVGFSYALTEIMSQLHGDKALATSKYPGLDFVTVLELLVQKTHPTGNIPGQEERDHYWGQLFGLQSFVQAGILFDKPKRWHTVLELLLKATKKKVWLRPQTGFVIAQAIPQMKKEEVHRTLAEITEAGLAKTPEGLGIWLIAADRFPDLKLPKPWTDPFSSKSLQEVAAVLKGSGQTEGEGADKSAASGVAGSAANQLAFTWDLLLNHFVKAATSGKPGTQDEFKMFWDRVIDQSYFSKNASDFQKITGFKIFQKFYREAAWQSEMLQDLFSKNFMTCITNQTTNAGTRLHRMAIQVLKSLDKTVEAHPVLLAPTLRGLLGEHGIYNFDERVEAGGDGAKPVEKLLKHANAANASDVIKVLKQCVLHAGKEEDDVQKRTQTYADYLARLVSKTGLAADDDAADAPSAGGLALQELANLAYPKPGKKGAAPSPAIQEACRTKLMSAVGHLLKRPADFPALCSTILSIDSDVIAMADEIKSEVVDASKRLRKLVKKGGDSAASGPDQGLAVLHAVAILQLYNDPGSDAIEVLGDTKECYEKLHGKDKVDGLDISEILVEVLLAILAGSSTLTRNASIQVFESFSPLMSQKALELLTDILAASESQRGLDSIFNAGEGEMEDEDEDESMEDVEDDDDEASTPDGESEEDSDDEDEDDAESKDESESDDEDDEDGEETDDGTASKKGDDLEALLMKTFNVSHTLDKDHEAESSDDDVDMSDSEMLALDEQLSGHFKLLKSKTTKKKDREEAKKQVIGFKHRVLDLLEVYVKKEAPVRNGLVFTIFVPLLQLIQTTKEWPLSNKAVKIINEAQKLLKKAKKNDAVAAAAADDELDVDAAVAQLRAIHLAANDPGESRAFAQAVSAASLAVAATLFAVDRENYRVIREVYAETQDRWVLEGLGVRASFFTDWINWCQAASSTVKAS